MMTSILEEEFFMVPTSDITLTLTTSTETVTIISDNSGLMRCFLLAIRRLNGYLYVLDNTFVFSQKANFDRCVVEAKDLGLLPS